MLIGGALFIFFYDLLITLLNPNKSINKFRYKQALI